ncbi:MAG TPA: branched-chain amino acid ABC transporter permease [Hyphomicrobiales bacterium]|nr:branched-chain amino acid ABC transporter permease [Hyphomicrobiales bacterium]
MTAIFEQVVNGTMMGAIYVLVALGMVLIFGVMEVLNFAHGVLFMAGGYLAWVFYYGLTGSYPASVILAALSLAVVGAALERGVFRRVRTNVPMQIVASLGLILIVQNGAVLLFGPSALAMRVPTVTALVHVGDLSFTQQHFVIIATAAAAIAALAFFLFRTRLGTAMRATSQNPEAARVVGVDPDRIHLLAFAIGSGLGGLGGALLGPLFLIFPQMGDLPLLKALTAIVLGGLGSIPGAIVGGFVIGIAEALSTLVVSTDYRDMVVFLLLIAVLLVRPWGLFGIRVRGEG